MFVNQYLVVKFLGRGACGKVFLCLNTYDLRLYAMKVRDARQPRVLGGRNRTRGLLPPRSRCKCSGYRRASAWSALLAAT